MTQPLIDQPDAPLIEVQHVAKRFATHRERARSLQQAFIRLVQRAPAPEHNFFWPLRDVSLTVHRGDTIGIVGPNGSGKSTLLKLITGILEPTSGTIHVRGRVSSLLELGAGFHPDLTGRENIYLNGSIYGLNRGQMDARLDEIIDFAELGDFIDTPVKHYSSGMYVRLGFAVAIHTEPDILIVDEVLTVGDQGFQQKCLERIYELKRQGIAILLVSHNLDDLELLCERALWLHEGYVRLDGAAAEVVDRYLAFANDRYYERRAERQAGRDPAAHRIEQSESRWGTGQAEITRVELLDANSQPSHYFDTDGPLHLCLHYQTHEPVERPAFGLAIYRRDGVHINGPNSVHEGVPIDKIDGAGTVDYIIDRLLLQAGHYEFTVALYNTDSTVALDHHHRLYPFEVRTPAARRAEGIVHLDARWQHAPQVHVNGATPAASAVDEAIVDEVIVDDVVSTHAA